jgi:hypothetical protein
MDFLRTLCESKLFPSEQSLKAKQNATVANLAYRYILILHVLLIEHETHSFAKTYAKRAAEWGGFEKWQSSGNDLYVLLHGLEKIDHPSKGKGHYTINLDQIQRWLSAEGRGQGNNGVVRRLFLRLDSDLKITNQRLRATRRTIMDWEDQTVRERADTLDRLHKDLHHDALRSELLKPLGKLVDHYQDMVDNEDNN